MHARSQTNGQERKTVKGASAYRATCLIFKCVLPPECMENDINVLFSLWSCVYREFRACAIVNIFFFLVQFSLFGGILSAGVSGSTVDDPLRCVALATVIRSVLALNHLKFFFLPLHIRCTPLSFPWQYGLGRRLHAHESMIHLCAVHSFSRCASFFIKGFRQRKVFFSVSRDHRRRVSQTDTKFALSCPLPATFFFSLSLSLFLSLFLSLSPSSTHWVNSGMRAQFSLSLSSRSSTSPVIQFVTETSQSNELANKNTLLRGNINSLDVRSSETKLSTKRREPKWSGK